MANEDYQIIALANLQLEKHLTENPLTLEGAQRVKWDVEETEFHKIAKGTSQAPRRRLTSPTPKTARSRNCAASSSPANAVSTRATTRLARSRTARACSERIAALDETAARARRSYTRYRKNMGH